MNLDFLILFFSFILFFWVVLFDVKGSDVLDYGGRFMLERDRRIGREGKGVR